MGEEIEDFNVVNVPNIIELLHKKTRRINRLENKIKDIKNHRIEFSHSRYIEWIQEFDRILEKK